jgi:hypothetical protein
MVMPASTEAAEWVAAHMPPTAMPAVRATKPSSVKIVEDEEFKVSSRVAFH